mgnify:CR=1 FL=1
MINTLSDLGSSKIFFIKLTDKDYFDAMINPRLAALAEIAWSSKAKRTWSQFRSSLLHNVDFLSNLGWKFHNF